ncbi:4-diphosphocytidyl-2C-methyl-D-erythritol synthase [Sulfitobacter noctilucicola]|uniref:CTP:molybdopterin cytidylyltransferase MocA n=1 Tax=Sulfitobacter noctilucicola TaxID=1342301 RepID=A0A7W6M8K3_9RHOB|nr:nucleotidyltransferase family protein [Sulfitobacter noctilucicola]KIN65224.1 4-diphosphocytidyl-2C-methyl-D-erythritol synthase [Sulfitobacter noctilucicola]MBB4173642.1 CTP:molybdopterin cytidylyltransferase MocA [Sulfitobacter noctilucicola]
MALHAFPIILLAAGASSRMRGRDKLLEDIGGTSLLRHQALKVRRATSGAVLVTLPTAPHPRYAALEGISVDLIAVPDAAEGINASLRRAFAALPEDAPCAMVMLADLPDLTENDLVSVLEAVDLSSDTLVWRGATETGKPGHPIVFDRALFEEFAGLDGDTGGRDVVALATGRTQIINLPDTHALNDLDTPEDWDAWWSSKNT